MGTFSDTSILVYQAFNNDIADYAIREQKYDFYLTLHPLNVSFADIALFSLGSMEHPAFQPPA